MPRAGLSGCAVARPTSPAAEGGPVSSAVIRGGRVVDPGQAQAAELLSGPANTDLRVVLVGDFNSPSAGGVTYKNVIAAGFTDAAFAGGIGGVPTCCQAADLMNPVSILDTRVDLVLFRGAFTVLNADVVGDHPDDRTPSGLWPSDHAGVAVTLELPYP